MTSRTRKQMAVTAIQRADAFTRTALNHVLNITPYDDQTREAFASLFATRKQLAEAVAALTVTPLEK